MDKILGPISNLIGGKITSILDFNKNEQALLEKLQELRDKVADIEIEVKKAELSGKKRKRMEVGSWLEKVKKIKKEWDELKDTLRDTGSIKRWRHGSRVKELREVAEELIQKGEKFRELVVDACGTGRERFFVTTLHGESLRKELENILTALESDQVSVFGICGMGGVGKTTLANHICNNLQGTPDKWHVYWVTVSQEADINKLQNAFAEKLDIDIPRGYDVEEKAANLHKRLRDLKNVVLILDDVWEYIDLTKLGMDPKADKWKVIITSRRLCVCYEIGCKDIVKVQPLPEEDAWTLFLEKLNYKGELSPEVEGVAMTVAKKCKGLPLGIITLARSMSGVNDIREWRNTLEELTSSIEKNGLKSEVFPILQISYNRLRNSKLQNCFLYCSLYTEDYQISRDELISKFICEGLMNQKGSRAAKYDQGHALINSLVRACLLESAVKDGREYVKMHDLLREMAVDITRDKPRFMNKAGLQLQALPCEDEWMEDLERVSLMENRISEIPKGSSPKCPRLSTLILTDNPLKFIPDSFFAHMCNLRVLDLRNTSIEKLPNSILESENLTALLLGGCRSLHYVPSLGKLKALIELDISYTRIQEVPEGMEYLIKLKRLNMGGMDILIKFPRGLLPRLSHLECLRLPYHIKIQAEEVESLELLEEFVGSVDDMFTPKWLHKSPTLSFYKIKAGGKCPYWNGDSLLYRRTICFDEFAFKPSIDVPQNIECIDFIGCKGNCLLDSIPSMHLKGCWIEECNEIESIMRISATTSNNDEGPLKNLDSLTLWNLENFNGWFKWEERAQALPPCGTFSSLTCLWIFGCRKMKILFPHKLLANNLRNLKEIDVRDCDEMKEIIADDEEEDGGVGSISSSNNKYTNIITYPKFTRVWLFRLPQLESIYKGAISCCDSIERIKIMECPKLERLPFFNPSVDENSTIPFPRLLCLALVDLPELKNICNRINGTSARINCCDSIMRIDVWGCRQLRRLPLYLPLINGQPSPPPKLEHILIGEKENEWWESLEWDHPNSINVLSRFLRKC